MLNNVRCCLAFLLVLLCDAALGASPASILYVGTYTSGQSEGIYSFRYDGHSGKLTPLGLAAETANPSFLTVDGSGKFLFAVNEVDEYKGAPTGAVSAFAIDHKSGKLAFLNQVASGGTGPCYVVMDRSGRYVLVANYNGGSVAVLPVSPDGHLSEASSVMKDTGELGPVKGNQNTAHAHWIQASARNRFVYVADLGLDRILIYKFDAEKGLLSRGESSVAKTDFFSAKLASGTGPRHVAFSEDGNFMYVLGEIDSTVTVFANDAKETYRPIQKISSLPAGYSGKKWAAEIAIHPNEKFLYTSNRGDDSIAVFAINKSTGQLSFVQRISSGGKTPRNFVIDSGGSRLFVANQDSSNIVEFRIDTTGKLKSVGEVAKAPSPVCLVFVATH